MGNNQWLEKFSHVVWACGGGIKRMQYTITIRVSSEIKLNTRQHGEETVCRIIVELCQNIFASSPNEI